MILISTKICKKLIALKYAQNNCYFVTLAHEFARVYVHARYLFAFLYTRA